MKLKDAIRYVCYTLDCRGVPIRLVEIAPKKDAFVCHACGERIEEERTRCPAGVE